MASHGHDRPVGTSSCLLHQAGLTWPSLAGQKERLLVTAVEEPQQGELIRPEHVAHIDLRDAVQRARPHRKHGVGSLALRNLDPEQLIRANLRVGNLKSSCLVKH